MEAKDREIVTLKEWIQVVESKSTYKMEISKVISSLRRIVSDMVVKFIHELNLMVNLQNTLVDFNMIVDGKMEEILHFKVQRL